MLPATLFAPTPKAAKRVIEFFTTQINNDHTRKAYLNATRRFAQWCEARGIAELAGVEPFHVAAFVKELKVEFSAPTVKQHLDKGTLETAQQLANHESPRTTKLYDRRQDEISLAEVKKIGI
jgi:hypothetical protein